MHDGSGNFTFGYVRGIRTAGLYSVDAQGDIDALTKLFSFSTMPGVAHKEQAIT